MRQGQQNRRNRGRGRNRTGNPLTKSYESNGPDVKIKGTAADIAQKYMTLARDQLSSGNPVAAESYLQHAEHYNRIIMAAQAKQEEMGPQGRPHNGTPRFDADDDGDDDFDDADEGGIPGYGEQPMINIEVAAGAEENKQPRRRPARAPRTREEKSEPTEAEGSDSKETSGIGA